MGRADESVAVVDWATLTGRDARWEGVVPCEAMYRALVVADSKYRSK